MVIIFFVARFLLLLRLHKTKDPDFDFSEPYHLLRLSVVRRR